MYTAPCSRHTHRGVCIYCHDSDAARQARRQLAADASPGHVPHLQASAERRSAVVRDLQAVAARLPQRAQLPGDLRAAAQVLQDLAPAQRDQCLQATSYDTQERLAIKHALLTLDAGAPESQPQIPSHLTQAGFEAGRSYTRAETERMLLSYYGPDRVAERIAAKIDLENLGMLHD